MQQHLGHVDERSSPLHQTQQQVVVLRTVGACTKPAHCDERLPANRYEMRDVVGLAQTLGREVGFVDGVGEAPIGPDDVVIGVDHVCGWVAADRTRQRSQRLVGEHIIVIEQHDPLTGRSVECVVAGGDDAPIRRSMVHRAPTGGAVVEHFVHRRVG